MKKLLLIFLLFIANMAFAQDDTFLGLKFSKKYTSEQIIDAIGKDLLIKEENNKIFNSYYFRDVTYNRDKCPFVYVQTLKDGEFVVFSIAYYTQDEAKKKVNYEKKYLELKDFLCRKYEMEPVQTDDPSLTRLDYNGIVMPSIRLDKHVENGITTAVELTYFALPGIAAILQSSVDNMPTIQDSFFGMKFGTKQDKSSMKTSVGIRGNFEKTINSGTEYVFSKVDFAGLTWDFASLITNREGLFYSFTAYNTYETYSYNEQKRADKTYNYIRSKLDEKYGSGADKEKTEENGKTIVYTGKNMVIIMLSNHISKSAGGSYRRYVTLSYIQTEISENVSQAATNEL